MGNSKKKGGNYERDIAKKLSLWWTYGEDGNVFYRSNSSGARGKTNNNIINSYADISAIKPGGYLLFEVVVIECKKGYGSRRNKKCKKCKSDVQFIEKWDLLSIIDSDNTNHIFVEFLGEIYEDAELASTAAGKDIYPVIIFRRDGRQDVISIPERLYKKVTKHHKDINQLSILYLNNPSSNYENVYLLRLDQFLKEVDPEIFKTL